MTYKYQALDVGVMGPFKIIRQSLFLKNGWNNAEHSENFHVNLIRSILDTLSRISCDTVRKSFLKSFMFP